MPETGVLPEGLVYVIKDMASGPFKGHLHEEYWLPVAPGEV